jgi:hypothetical protein
MRTAKAREPVLAATAKASRLTVVTVIMSTSAINTAEPGFAAAAPMPSSLGVEMKTIGKRAKYLILLALPLARVSQRM